MRLSNSHGGFTYMTSHATNSEPVNARNLAASFDQIKAIGASKLTAAAKYIAVLMLTTGEMSPTQLRALSGLGKTTVYRVQAEIFESEVAYLFETIPESPTSPAIPADGNKASPESPAYGKITEKSVPQVPPMGLSEPDPSCARDITPRATKELPSEVVILNNYPPTPLKRKPKPEFGRTQALEAFHAYNAAALIAAIPQASRMTPDRERKIIARLKEFGLEGWYLALENIKSSPFLKGDGGNGKWRASLDFLLQASSFAKVHDGAYSANPKPAAAPMAALLKPRPRIKSEEEIYQENIAWAKSQGLLDEHVH